MEVFARCQVTRGERGTSHPSYLEYHIRKDMSKDFRGKATNRFKIFFLPPEGRSLKATIRFALSRVRNSTYFFNAEKSSKKDPGHLRFDLSTVSSLGRTSAASTVSRSAVALGGRDRRKARSACRRSCHGALTVRRTVEQECTVPPAEPRLATSSAKLA